MIRVLWLLPESERQRPRVDGEHPQYLLWPAYLVPVEIFDDVDPRNAFERAIIELAQIGITSANDQASILRLDVVLVKTVRKGLAREGLLDSRGVPVEATARRPSDRGSLVVDGFSHEAWPDLLLRSKLPPPVNVTVRSGRWTLHLGTDGEGRDCSAVVVGHPENPGQIPTRAVSVPSSEGTNRLAHARPLANAPLEFVHLACPIRRGTTLFPVRFPYDGVFRASPLFAQRFRETVEREAERTSSSSAALRAVLSPYAGGPSIDRLVLDPHPLLADIASRMSEQQVTPEDESAELCDVAQGLLRHLVDEEIDRLGPQFGNLLPATMEAQRRLLASVAARSRFATPPYAPKHEGDTRSAPLIPAVRNLGEVVGAGGGDIVDRVSAMVQLWAVSNDLPSVYALSDAAARVFIELRDAPMRTHRKGEEALARAHECATVAAYLADRRPTFRQHRASVKVTTG